MKKILVHTLTTLLISLIFLNKYTEKTFNQVISNPICNKKYKDNYSYKERVTFNKDQPIEIIEYKNQKNKLYK